MLFKKSYFPAVNGTSVLLNTHVEKSLLLWGTIYFIFKNIFPFLFIKFFNS